MNETSSYDPDAVINAAHNPLEPIYDGDEEIKVCGNKIEQYDPYKHWHERKETRSGEG